MSKHILIVEDEPALSEVLRYNLEKEGYRVSLVEDGALVMARILDDTPGLVVLDWMLPNLSGIEICRQIRANTKVANLPVIMLTARGEESDRIKGLDTGADDYLTKPFSIAELALRIKAILRRSQPDAGTGQTFGDIEINRDAKRVSRNGVDIPLGPKEYELLSLMMGHPGRVYTREQLLDHVWGQGVYVEDRTVDVHIGRLRKALNKRALPDPIRTVRATGYAFDETYNP